MPMPCILHHQLNSDTYTVIQPSVQPKISLRLDDILGYDVRGLIESLEVAACRAPRRTISLHYTVHTCLVKQP